MKLLRQYFVLVLLFVLLCFIVSLSLFARIIQVPLDSHPWPSTSSASASAEMIDGDSNQKTSAALRTDTDKANKGTEDVKKANRTKDKVHRDQENMIRQLAEEIRSLVGQRDQLHEDLVRLRNQIQHLR